MSVKPIIGLIFYIYIYIKKTFDEILIQALVEATLDPKYISIEQSTRLLVFFATPHCGGNGANFGDVVAGIVRFGLRRSSNRLVNELKKSSETANMRFEQARHLPATCLIISFCESDPLNPVTGVVRIYFFFTTY